MIEYKKSDILQNGFEHQSTLIDGMDSYIYRGKVLSYELIVDNRNNQVSISGDTVQPFGSDAMYEFHVPCKLIEFKAEEEIEYRNFHLSFYNGNEPIKESLVLTVSSRKSDGELVVWPYFKWQAHD